MSKVIAVAYADHHIHDWKSYSTNHSRLDLSCRVFKQVSEFAKKYKVPVLFAGDLFHSPNSLENITISKSLEAFKTYMDGIMFYAISGNHDLDNKSTYGREANSHLRMMNLCFKNFICIDKGGVIIEKDFVVGGIPYYNSNIGFKEKLEDLEANLKTLKSSIVGKKKILLIHTDLHNAVNRLEMRIDSVQNIPVDMDRFFRKWDLVLSGHIHVPQRLGENIYMLGAPYHQDWGDRNVEMGLWLIYDDAPPKFIYLKNPEFKTLKPNEKAKDDYHIYREESLPSQRENKDSEGEEGGTRFCKTSRSRLAKTYAREKGVEDQGKIKTLISLLKEV